jgi:hypothetical protein
MRARSLKPGLFSNELLGKADPLITILFEGLWCSADKEGRLEDRPLKLCGQIFPYRRSVTEKRVDKWLQWLHDEGFIARYQVDGKAYIQIIEFKKHQRPHQNEQPSKIPPLSSIHGAPRSTSSSTKVASEGEPNTQALRSDSYNSITLTPDSHIHTEGQVHQGTKSGGPPTSGEEPRLPPISDPERDTRDPRKPFARIQAVYPKGAHPPNLMLAQHNCCVLIERFDQTWNSLRAAAERYAAYVDAGGVSGPQFVMSIHKFFDPANDAKPWLSPWDPPPTKSEQRQSKALSETEQWLREKVGKHAAP